MSLGQNEAKKLYYGIILDQENIIIITLNYTYKIRLVFVMLTHSR